MPAHNGKTLLVVFHMNDNNDFKKQKKTGIKFAMPTGAPIYKNRTVSRDGSKMLINGRSMEPVRVYMSCLGKWL